MSTCLAVQCPHGHSAQIVQGGQTARRTPRSLWQNTRCVPGRVLLDARTRGCLPAVKQLVVERSLNARGMHETARSLPSSPDTVLNERRTKATALESVHTALLRPLHPGEVRVDSARAGEAAREAMWSGRASKSAMG